MVDTGLARIRRKAGTARELSRRLLADAGLRHSEARISADSQAYWSDADTDRWKSDSHWRDGTAFDGSDVWSRIGARHLEIFRRGARAAGFDGPWSRVVEWGCGGGANAVHFAPLTPEFVGVDLSRETLDRCGREVSAAAPATTWRPVRVAVDDPEAALTRIEPCDVWLCLYVFELLPSQEYGTRLLRIAHRMLNPGGVALVQIKYSDGRWATRPRRRDYRSGLASMTTYRIDEFWALATACGFTPCTVELVPRDELDQRYAYFLLSRP